MAIVLIKTITTAPVAAAALRATSHSPVVSAVDTVFMPENIGTKAIVLEFFINASRVSDFDFGERPKGTS